MKFKSNINSITEERADLENIDTEALPETLEELFLCQIYPYTGGKRFEGKNEDISEELILGKSFTLKGQSTKCWMLIQA